MKKKKKRKDNSLWAKALPKIGTLGTVPRYYSRAASKYLSNIYDR